MNIALNAHLLSGQAGFRSAGIHGYLENTLLHLPAITPNDAITAFVGAQYAGDLPGLHIRRSRWNTESPARRILWEQLAQPAQLRGFDLYHAGAFVRPLLMPPMPTVVTVYDLSFIHYPERLSPLRRAYLSAMTRFSIQHARRVIAISHSTAHDLAHTLGVPPDRIDIAQPGYDRARFHPLPPDQIAAFRAERNLPERYWLFIGTLEPRKNLVTLIEAYAGLAETHRLPLILAGGKGWDYTPIFAAVARHGLEKWVSFPGFLPPHALPLWYNGAEAFLYPSVFEGFGLPVLEAMACGTPVLVSNASSLPEVVGDLPGSCLPPHDVQAWRAALLKARDRDWQRTTREHGLNRAQAFSWEKAALATAASYQQALS